MHDWQVSNQRVQSLKAVSKKDATSIFKKCAKNDEGKTVPRLTQVTLPIPLALTSSARITCSPEAPSGEEIRASISLR